MGASCSMAALLSQVSTSYPRVPRDSFARTRACFLMIQLSRYEQFMQSTSFLPLHGCWLLHYDLCPSHFHIHSDRLFRIISVLSLSFHIDSIFYWKERNGLPLSFSLSFHTPGSYDLIIKHLIIQKATTAKCFAKKYLLFFCRINSETICYVQYFFSPWVSMYWRITSTGAPPAVNRQKLWLQKASFQSFSLISGYSFFNSLLLALL